MMEDGKPRIEKEAEQTRIRFPTRPLTKSSHIVSFPSRDAFHEYLQDPEILALASLRSTAIRETVMWFGSYTSPFR